MKKHWPGVKTLEPKSAAQAERELEDVLDALPVQIADLVNAMYAGLAQERRDALDLLRRFVAKHTPEDAAPCDGNLCREARALLARIEREVSSAAAAVPEGDEG